MTTERDWVQIKLNPAELASCEYRARRRQDAAIQRGLKPKGHGSLATNRLGCQGELAVAKFCGVDLDDDWTLEGDKRRGCDVAGLQVRARSRADHGLWLNQGDSGRFVLVLGHDLPYLHLAGWTGSIEGFASGAWRTTRTQPPHRYCEVPQDALKPVSELLPKPAPPPVIRPGGPIDPISGPWVPQVRDYLALCLDVERTKYHPSADGAVKLIYHGADKDAATEIRRAYAVVTEYERRRTA